MNFGTPLVWLGGPIADDGVLRARSREEGAGVVVSLLGRRKLLLGNAIASAP